MILKLTYQIVLMITSNGHIDSIRAMVFYENFIKPYSVEHTLVYLLTKSF